MEKKSISVQKTVTLLTVIIFFGVLTWINFFCYRRFVDSDSAAEALLAMRIRGTHHLFPETWYISTDRRTIATAVLASVIYLLSGNISFSMALSCTIFSVVMAAALIYMLKGAGASQLTCLTALLLIMALPVSANGIMFESRFPYFMTLLYLFASHYSGYFTFFFLTAGVMLRMRGEGFGKSAGPDGVAGSGGTTESVEAGKSEGSSGSEESRKTEGPSKLGRFPERANSLLILQGLLCITAFIYGAAGMRGMQLVVFPFLVHSAICYLGDSKGLTAKAPGSLKVLALSGIMTVSALVGSLFSGAPSVHTGMSEARHLFTYFVTAFFTNPASLLGTQKTESLSDPASVMQLLMWGTVIISVYALCRLMKRGKREEKLLLSFVLCSYLLTVFILTVTSFNRAERYSCMAVLIVVLSLSLFTEHLRRGGYDTLSAGLTFFFVFYALLNLVFTYIPAIADRGWDSDSKEVLSWMEEKGYGLGYARDWDADRLMVKSNALITFGTVTSDLTLDENGDLVSSRWLTDMNWYPPAIDRDQPCVYVIPNDSEFDAEIKPFLEAHPDAEKAFENESYVCYLTPEVYVN